MSQTSSVFDRLKDAGKLITSENLSSLSVALLIFFVLSSKHIIIYNEETLVVLCFFGFIATCQMMFSESIQSSLNERSQAIQLELLNSVNLKEQLVQNLIEEHSKQLVIQTTIRGLGQFSLNEIAQISSQREKALQSLFTNEINQKLKTLSNLGSAGPMGGKIQSAISLGFRGVVLEEFHRSKKTLKTQFVQQAVNALKKSI
jgi:hypothetical protein